MEKPSPLIGAYTRALTVWSDWSMDNDVLTAFAHYQRAKGLAETTIRNRASILGSLQRATGRSLLELRIPDLRAHLGRQQSPGRTRASTISAGTRRTEYSVMLAFYAFAVEDGYLTENPTARLAKVTAPKGTARPFAPEQIDAMLNSGAYHRTRVMILLGYYQGFRVSSIARVHGHDIDLLAGTIRTIGKGSKDRTLPLHPVIAEVALEMPADDWWFPARNGADAPIKSASVTDRITRAKHRAGITDPNLTPHSLRHSFGTELVDQGVNIRIVQELMMHESLGTTQIYTGVSARLKREGIRALPARDVPSASGRRGALAA